MIALTFALAMLTPDASPLERNAPGSDYRLIFGISGNDGFEGRPISSLRGAVLADVGNMRRNPDGSRTLPIVFIRPASEADPDREVFIYHDANVNCQTRQYDSGTPHYENTAGPIPLNVNMTWRPTLGTDTLGIVRDIVCSPVRAGAPVGPKTRNELLTLLSPE